ncbi:MAG: cytochrome b561 [Limimaricola cinnabarinus]|jgi:cytochrome b561|uniref:cytochrome b n=1 Tax=Limimaricola cinnabarinus TaxID=1125964 RepID=UPI0039E6302F
MTDRSFATDYTPSSDQGGYSRLSRLLHWSVAAGFLGALAIGLLLDWLPREARGVWLDPHRTLGLGVLAFGMWRLLRRVRIGFPAPEALQPRWQALAARATHWALLAATLAMPLSGVLMTVARGRAVELWGLTVIPAWGEIGWLAATAGALHEAALPVLVGLVALHLGGALKHHLVDHDDTLRRMLGNARERHADTGSRPHASEPTP